MIGLVCEVTYQHCSVRCQSCNPLIGTNADSDCFQVLQECLQEEEVENIDPLLDPEPTEIPLEESEEILFTVATQTETAQVNYLVLTDAADLVNCCVHFLFYDFQQCTVHTQASYCPPKPCSRSVGIQCHMLGISKQVEAKPQMVDAFVEPEKPGIFEEVKVADEVKVVRPPTMDADGDDSDWDDPGEDEGMLVSDDDEDYSPDEAEEDGDDSLEEAVEL